MSSFCLLLLACAVCGAIGRGLGLIFGKRVLILRRRRRRVGSFGGLLLLRLLLRLRGVGHSLLRVRCESHRDENESDEQDRDTHRCFVQFTLPVKIAGMSLMIRSSSIHAAGCYTTAPIRKGVKVLEYTGPRLTKRQADKRYQDSSITYLFGVGDGTRVINGHGMAMFINHSCDPNCETEEIAGRVWIISIRPIKAGEELTYDYNLYDGDDDEARCYCGAATCKKTMYSTGEVERREKALKRKKTR